MQDLQAKWGMKSGMCFYHHTYMYMCMDNYVCVNMPMVVLTTKFWSEKIKHRMH